MNVNLIKTSSHIMLVLISIILSINLFVSFTGDLPSRIIFGILAISFELIKVYALIEFKYLYEKKKRVLFIFYFIIYFGLAVVSIIASLGYTLLVIENDSLQFGETVRIERLEIDILKQEYEENKKQIEILQDNSKDLDFSAVERSLEMLEGITLLQSKNKAISGNIYALERELENRGEALEQLSNREMFSLLGKPIGVSGSNFMFYMMFIFSLFLEFAIAITSGKSLASTPMKYKRMTIPYNILYYISEAVKEDGSIVEDDKVMKTTGLPKERILALKKMLYTMKYKGIRLFDKKGVGKYKSSYNRSNLKKIVGFFIDTQ